MQRTLGALTSSRVYIVRGESMGPAVRSGDRLLVGGTETSMLRRGHVVVFFDPRGSGGRRLKRVVGMPGEVIRTQDGRLLIDGVPLLEPYLRGLPAVIGLRDASWEVGRGEFFLLGDNRAHSTDSRDFGPVSAGSVVGRAWLRYWPVTRFGRVD